MPGPAHFAPGTEVEEAVYDMKDISFRSTCATIVAGPPASGKSTFVQKMVEPGDLVYDFDAIACALFQYYSMRTTVHGFVGNASVYRRANQIVAPMRDSLIDGWREMREKDRPRLWYICSAPTRGERERLSRILYNAEIIVLETSEGECRRRCEKDPIRAAEIEFWYGGISRWFLDHENDNAI